MMRHVINNIYIGDLDSVKDVRKMRSIDVIIDLSDSRYEELKNKRYIHMKMKDLTSFQIDEVIDQFDQVMKQIEPEEKMLIHCVSGTSRSPTLILYYLMRYQGYDLRRAYVYLRSKSFQNVSPNFGFFKQLLIWERKILGYNSLSIEEYFRLEYELFQ